MLFWLQLLEFVKLVNSGAGPYFRTKADEDAVVVVFFSANTFLS